MYFTVLFITVGIATLNIQAFAEECYPTFVDCYCDKNFEQFIQIPVNTSLHKDNDSGVYHCAADRYAPDVCQEKNCVLVPNENFKTLFPKGHKKFIRNNTKDGGFFKSKRSVGTEKESFLFDCPEEIVISPRDDYSKREKRSYGSCELPELENSEVTCWKWPNWVTCNQECIYGHGLQKGKNTVTKTSMNCRYTEDKWKPHAIEDCKPFFNCKAHLISPGDLNCVQLTKKPSYCEIRCEEYDDNGATDLSKYTCDGKMNLPHCAILDKSVTLISPPSN